MKLRPLLKSKKGIAIESAVLFMMIIFTFCSLLASLALAGHYQVELDSLKASNYAQTQQIGEEFVAYLQVAEPSETTEEPDAAEEADAPENFAVYLAENNIQYEDYSCEEVKTQDNDIIRYELTVKQGSGESANAVLYIKAEKTAQGQVTVYSWLPAPPETAEK